MINHVSLKYTRHVNLLREEKNREVRISTIDDLSNLFYKFNSENQTEIQEIHDFLVQLFLPQLLLTLEDQITLIRSKVLKLLQFLISNHSKFKIEEKEVSLIFSAIYNRLDYQNKIYVEAIEDLRIEVINFIKQILSSVTFNISPFISEFFNILGRICHDANPEMKEKIAELIIWIFDEYINLLTNKESLLDQFKSSTSNLIVGISLNTTHQRNKIRKLSIIALTKLLSINNKAFSNIHGSYRNCSIDNNAEVRLTTFECLSSLLRNFNITNLKKYEGIIIKYFITGLSDEKNNIKSYCYNEIEALGEYRKKLEDSIENNSNNTGMDVEKDDENDDELEKQINNKSYTHSITSEEKKMILNTNKSIRLNELSNNMQIEDLNKLIQNK